VLLPGRWFSVNAVIDDAPGCFRKWYVNFQRPYRQSGRWVDTCDLFLDLEVDVDLALRWQDEAAYEQARRLGVVAEAEAEQVQRAREEAEVAVRRAVAELAARSRLAPAGVARRRRRRPRGALSRSKFAGRARTRMP
jgi:predicted RNA-binding protein associated with RNAse of E/G family